MRGVRKINWSTDNLAKRMKSNDEIILTQEQIQSLQRAETEMMSYVISCCERRGVEYTLGGGSCLGAVRHHGFIPWDDDADINISRSSYADLLEELQKTCNDEYTVLYPGGSLDTGFATTFIQKNGTRVRTLANIDKERCGLSMDVFVIENAFENPVLRWLHGVLCMAMGFCLSCRRYYQLRDLIIPSIADDSEAKSSIAAKAHIGRLLSFAKLSTWVRWTDRVYSLCKNDQSKYIVIPTGRRHYFKETYERTTIFPASPGEFEGYHWMLPADTDTYLTHLYGSNYMTPPPPEDRERHIVFEFDLGENKQ